MDNICSRCGEKLYFDIDSEEWAHKCSDGRLRFGDGSLAVRELNNAAKCTANEAKNK